MENGKLRISVSEHAAPSQSMVSLITVINYLHELLWVYNKLLVTTTLKVQGTSFSIIFLWFAHKTVFNKFKVQFYKTLKMRKKQVHA